MNKFFCAAHQEMSCYSARIRRSARAGLNLTNCEGATVEIINVMGQAVLTKTDVKGTIDVSSVPDGFYLVKVSNKKSQIVRKINIQQ